MAVSFEHICQNDPANSRQLSVYLLSSRNVNIRLDEMRMVKRERERERESDLYDMGHDDDWTLYHRFDFGY